MKYYQFYYVTKQFQIVFKCLMNLLILKRFRKKCHSEIKNKYLKTYLSFLHTLKSDLDMNLL